MCATAIALFAPPSSVLLNVRGAVAEREVARRRYGEGLGGVESVGSRRDDRVSDFIFSIGRWQPGMVHARVTQKLVLIVTFLRRYS